MIIMLNLSAWSMMKVETELVEETVFVLLLLKRVVANE